MKKEFSIKTLLEGFFNAFNLHKGFFAVDQLFISQYHN